MKSPSVPVAAVPSREFTKEDRLLLFLRGWKIGAAASGCDAVLFEYLDFALGHAAGRKASMAAYAKASKRYKATLSPLR